MKDNARKMAVLATLVVMVAMSSFLVISLDDDSNDVDAAVTRHTYTLNFNANGGTGAPETMTKQTSADSYSFTIPDQVPTRNGYTFLGWSTSSSGQALMMPGDYFEVYTAESGYSDTLYAIWQSGTFDGSITIIPEVSISSPAYVTYGGTRILEFDLSYELTGNVVYYTFKITKVGSYSGDHTLTTGYKTDEYSFGESAGGASGGTHEYIRDSDWPVGETRVYDKIAGAMSIVDTPGSALPGYGVLRQNE